MDNSQAIPPKEYYIRDCDIELVLKQVETLIKLRSEVFLEKREAQTEVQVQLYEEMLEYYNRYIKELLKL